MLALLCHAVARAIFAGMKRLGLVLALSTILFSHAGYCQSVDTAAVHERIAMSKKNQWIDSYRSLSYADEALIQAQQIGYPEGVARAKNQKGFSYWSLGDNDLAIQEVLDALRIAQEIHNELIQAESYYVLARGYMDVAEREKAWEALQHAEQLAVKYKNWELQCSIYNLMGVVQFIDHREDSALKLYNKAYELGKVHSVEPINYPRIVSNIGECYAIENPALAFTYFRKALDLANETGNQIAKASITAIIGHAYLRGKDLKQAESSLLDALKLARSLGLRRVIRHAYSGLVDIKLQQGKGDEAVVYLRKYYDVRDSLLNASKVRQIVELESRHALELKEKNIQILEDEKRIKSIWNNILLGIVAVVIVMGAGLYQLQRFRYRKNRQLLNLEIDYLTARNKEIQEAVKASLASHHDGPAESQDQKILREAISVVERHLDDAQFSVELMADELHMSRTSLHRKIKTITGFPPSELIRTIRLRTAARLIDSKADTVTQIALKVGFDDYSHFSKTFKKHFGVSPTSYEAQAHQGNEEGRKA